MPQEAITHDDTDTRTVPESRSDWDGWVAATAVRNHVLGDPLLDWLDRYGESKGYKRDKVDPRTDFGAFILNKGVEFEAAVVKHLGTLDVGEIYTVCDGPGCVRDLDAALETWNAMTQGVPIIAQGVLRDPQTRTYGSPDLLVRSDVLAKLFPENFTTSQAAVTAGDLGIGDCHYVVVDIKYTTLKLTVDGSLSNTGSAAAHKAQLHIYNRALGRLQGYLPPRAFLCGRGTEQTIKGETTRINNSMTRIAGVEHDETTRAGSSLSDRTNDAVDWVRRMRSEGNGWDVLPPSVDELRPNAGGGHGVWSSAVKRIIETGGDLTVLRNVSVTKRQKANKAGLFDWRDEAVTASELGVNGAVSQRLLDALLDVNRTEGPVVRPARIEAARTEWINTPTLEFYVDFETVSDINDDFAAIPDRGGQPLIFMIGCGHVEDGQWTFECFVAEQLTEPAEAKIVEKWLDHMNTVRRRLDPAGSPKVIHWSAHEVSSLTDAAARCGACWEAPNWFDFLNQVINAEPVVVKGAHGFGLKAVNNAMHTHGLVRTRWQNGPGDGVGAMVGAWWCQNEIDEGRAARLMGLEMMRGICDYNEVDCEAMMQIVRYLRGHH